MSSSDDEEYGGLDDSALIAVSHSFEEQCDLPVTNNKARVATSNAAGRTDDDEEDFGPLFTSDLGDDFENEIAPRSTAIPRQRDLFGNVVDGNTPAQTTTRSWRLTNHQEPPTHHKLDLEAAKTWIYPSNLAHREYQFNIVKRALFSNVLVALPTGLGKTFIAATVMLNWYRWAPESQIVFMAPTKPLVTQQVDACHTIAGIPKSQTCQLTGNVSPAIRAEYWKEKRVFFMTPQTLETDLTSGRCDAKKISLIVVDEAHRATGAYAYVKVIQFIRRFNRSFRVMALTATPGSKVETVQEVITSLGIARTEIRTEESLDIREYVQKRNIEVEKFELTDEMNMLKDLFCEALKPPLRKLNEQKVYHVTDPIQLTAFTLHDARGKWMNSAGGRTANMGLKMMINHNFTLLAQLAHALDLLLYHGVKPFYEYINAFYEEATKKANNGGKIVSSVIKGESFTKLLRRCKAFVSSSEFVGHPKLDYLTSTILRHFSDAAERGEDDSKAMVFANYRNSGEEILRNLKAHAPIIKPQLFIGQSAGKNGEGGMSQKEQQAVIEKFKKNIFNVLVATSIGEEGLDIGEVDFIICYDASASPIRMLQRMGRTGRKRTGGVLVLVTEGKESKKWDKANDNYRWIQNKIALGKDFQYEEDLSPRIIPSEIEPRCEKKHIDPPVENRQPSPTRRNTGRGRKKAPPRKFHMPDGVETGFTTAAHIGGFRSATTSRNAKSMSFEAENDDDDDELPEEDTNETVEDTILSPEAGLLSPQQEADLKRRYQTIYGSDDDVLMVQYPRLDAYSSYQTRFTRTYFVQHGRATTAMVNMMRNITSINDQYVLKLETNLRDEDKLKPQLQQPLLATSSPKPASSPPFQVVVDNHPSSRTPNAPSSARTTGLSQRPASSINTPTPSRVKPSITTSMNSKLGSSFMIMSSQNTEPDDMAPPSSIDLPMQRKSRSSSEESDDLPSASQLLRGLSSSSAVGSTRKKAPSMAQQPTKAEPRPPAKRKSQILPENQRPARKSRHVITDSDDD